MDDKITISKRKLEKFLVLLEKMSATIDSMLEAS